METKVMTVTPEMAALWLERNTNNRRVTRQRVMEYARAMLDGNWRLTHQGIAFDQDGVLIDGQHRLEAVIVAGIPVPMNVTRGVERHDGELLEIDVGRGRTYKNIVQMAGIESRLHTTMNGVVLEFMRGKMNMARGHVPAHIIVDYIDRHKDELEYIAEFYGFNGGSGKAVGYKHAPALVGAAALSALYGHENRDAIAKFGLVWTKNDTSCTNFYNVKIALDCRDKVRNMRNTNETFNFVENCIRCFANNLTVVRLIDCYKLDKSAVL